MTERLDQIRETNRRRNQDTLVEGMERDLGRSLTPAEMKQAAETAKKISDLPLRLYGER